jgi:putative MFS transporter
MRAQGMSYAAGMGRLGSIMAPYAVGFVMGKLGPEMGYLASFSMFAFLLFFTGIAVLCLGIETKGRSLEELTA